MKEFKEKHKEDLSENLVAIEKLRVHCERAKKILSEESEATIICQKLTPQLDFQITITRAKYEELCDDLLPRCVPPVVIAMKDAEMTVQDIDEVVLVGDFTRTPMIFNTIGKMFEGKHIRQHDVTSHYFASHGAALESAVVQGVSGKEHKDLLQLDATSRGLGLETSDGLMAVIIPRNTAYPCHRRHIFTTTKDN